MTTRKEIRELACNAVKAVDGRFTVFDGRHIDNVIDVIPCAVVSMDDISMTMNLSGGRQYEGDLTIGFFQEGGLTDSEADVVVDRVLDKLTETLFGAWPGVGMTPAAIVYDRDFDPGVNLIVVTWQGSWTD